MLVIQTEATEEFDSNELHFEHSLVSLSKWEQVHEKAFFSREERTEEETRNYISKMLVSEHPPRNFMDLLTYNNIITITHYINSKQTATVFSDMNKGRPSSEIITNELIYYWMTQFNIPFIPCENWHLNRLMTLVKICGIKQSKPTPMSETARMEQMRKLNDERRAKLGTTG